MWPDQFQQEVSRLLLKVAADSADERRTAAAELQNRFDALAKAQNLFPIPDALKPAALLNLAKAIQVETDSNALGRLASMVSLFGTRSQMKTQTDPERVMTDALIQRMNDPSVDHGGQAIVNAIERMGVAARLRAIKENRVGESFVRHNIVYGLASPGLSLSDADIRPAVIKFLAESSDSRDWMCICYNLDFWVTAVPRGELKEALVSMWKKANGQAKGKVEEALHKGGFSRVLSWWI